MPQSTVIQCLVIKKNFVLWLDDPVNNFSIMLGCDHFLMCVNHYTGELKVLVGTTR